MPIYTELANTSDGLAFAREVFERARPGYHPITTASVQALLDKAGAAVAAPAAAPAAEAVQAPADAPAAVPAAPQPQQP